MINLRSGRRLLAVPVAVAVLSFVGLALAQPPQSGKAYVRVLLPLGADTALVTFGTQETKQTGRDRLFETPELQSGKKYYYEVTATWKADGKDVTRNKKVYVNPGQTAIVDFNKADKGDMKKPDTRTDEKPDTKTDDTKKPDTKTDDTKKPDTKTDDTKKPDTKTDETKKQQAQVTGPQAGRLTTVAWQSAPCRRTTVEAMCLATRRAT